MDGVHWTLCEIERSLNENLDLFNFAVKYLPSFAKKNFFFGKQSYYYRSQQFSCFFNMKKYLGYIVLCQKTDKTRRLYSIRRKHDATDKIHFKSKSFIDSIRVPLSIVCRVGREISFSIDCRR